MNGIQDTMTDQRKWVVTKLFWSNLQSKLRFFCCKFFTDPNNKERVISRDTQTWNYEKYYELKRSDGNLRVKHRQQYHLTLSIPQSKFARKERKIRHFRIHKVCYKGVLAWLGLSAFNYERSIKQLNPMYLHSTSNHSPQILKTIF